MTYDPDEQLEGAIAEYLAQCYAKRSAARASELAQFLGVSRVVLAVTAKRVMGTSAKAALHARQLTRAAELLTQTSAPIDEVCMLSGFGDRRTFYRVFRREMGTSPKAFRDENTKCL